MGGSSYKLNMGTIITDTLARAGEMAQQVELNAQNSHGGKRNATLEVVLGMACKQ